jgi:hypothetical protein
MSVTYDQDVLAWSIEQAKLLREGRFSELDIEHLADEIEDVGKSERRELESRLAVLMAHLLTWQHQPERRETSRSWLLTIREQRRSVERRIEKTPSLRALLDDAELIRDAWSDARVLASQETGLVDFSEDCPWAIREQVLQEGWFPG